jgi:hypothetical protein
MVLHPKKMKSAKRISFKPIKNGLRNNPLGAIRSSPSIQLKAVEPINSMKTGNPQFKWPLGELPLNRLLNPI